MPGSGKNTVKTLLLILGLAGGLYAAAVVPAPGETPCAPGAAAVTARGWESYRAGSVAAAGAAIRTWCITTARWRRARL